MHPDIAYRIATQRVEENTRSLRPRTRPSRPPALLAPAAPRHAHGAAPPIQLVPCLLPGRGAKLPIAVSPESVTRRSTGRAVPSTWFLIDDAEP